MFVTHSARFPTVGLLMIYFETLRHINLIFEEAFSGFDIMVWRFLFINYCMLCMLLSYSYRNEF